MKKIEMNSKLSIINTYANAKISENRKFLRYKCLKLQVVCLKQRNLQI